MTLWLHTLRALALPRRAVPIALVCGAMLLAQWWFTRDGWAVVIALALVAWFLLVGPWSWRALFPRGVRLARLPLYALVGGLPALLGWLLPRWSGLGDTFLTAGVNTLVVASLFWVGGWGLARDVEQEARVEQAEARAATAQRQAEQARLLALRAHLDPHFLFNTLNAIAEWTREDPEVAEAAILRLSGLLRELMAGVEAEAWPLSRELQVARAVWDLYAIRDPGRYQVQWSVPEPLPSVQVPPLLLLPLVENAVKHGPAAGHRGTLTLALSDGALRIENPGPFAGPRAGGEGLSLVRRRLELAGPGWAFSIGGQGDRTVATVRWP